jgi:hypothetical protein
LQKNIVQIIAYKIVKRLKEKGETKLLQDLSNLVSNSDRKNGKLYEVFEPSFD